ncbi:MAG: efflux transporter outer membrane subunit [Candidatus Omnitrophica bacterium]|nr:efflux transporter outer membrane subunit [Candidatus Omnitrophota bacterium]
MTFYLVEKFATRKDQNHKPRFPGPTGLTVSVWFLGLGIALLSGCAVGPNYHPPKVNTPPTFRDQTSSGTNSLADLPWWTIYRDETLQNLIREAFTNNYDLRVAVSRVEQARTLVAQARSTFFPQINYDGGAARGRQSFLGNPIPSGEQRGNPNTSSFLADFNAVWEVDLFGRLRRGLEQVNAQFLATEEARRGVTLTLLSDVAQAYFELLELDQLVKIAKRTTNSFGETLRLFEERLHGGVASKLETSRAEAALASAAASIPELNRQIMLKENQINVLLGRNPGPVARTATLLGQTMPPEVPAGLPSELLQRRPDILEAEQNLRAANATIGLAIGQFFPRIGLTAIYGGVSTDLSLLTSGGASVWSVAANVAGPVFQGGRYYAQYRQAKAAWEEARLRYQQTALNAFQEVSNALISRQEFARIRVELTRSVRAYVEAVDVSIDRYRAGKASYYEVLEAQQQLFPNENALAQTELNQLVVIVQLYKALGGGWEQPMDQAGQFSTAKNANTSKSHE